MRIHQPAVSRWVRTREDAERYIRAQADEICLTEGQAPTDPPVHPARSVRLSQMPEPLREAWISCFLERFDHDGWLPYTLADTDEAIAIAQREGITVTILPPSRNVP